MCDLCDEFDVEIRINGPEQLTRIIKKVRSAVNNDSLAYNSFESDRALIGQPSFPDLDVNHSLPDVMRYYFDCNTCGNVFGLLVETYHGQGGKWSRL